MKKGIFITLIMFWVSIAGAQDFKTIDKETYRLYQKEAWDSLINYYNNTVKPHDVDYYYLRMRVGIAYYSLNDYLGAIPHFLQALEFNSTAFTAKEYLYYCYEYTGQKAMTEHLASGLSEQEQEKLNYSPPSFFNRLRLEAGINFSDGPGQAGNIDIDGSANVYGEASFTGNTNYYHLSLVHRFLPGLSLFHGLSTFSINKEHHFSYFGETRVFEYDMKQNNYYFQPSYTFKNGLSIAAAYHSFNVEYDAPEFELKQTGPQYPLQHYEHNDYVLILKASRFFGKTNLGLSGSYSEINNSRQQQYGMHFSYLPYGNYRLVVGGKIIWFNQQNTGETIAFTEGNELIAEPNVLVSLSDRIWVEAGYTFGTLYNYHEDNAFIVYNIPDKIVNKAEVTLNVKLNKHLKFDLRYRYLNRKDNYLSYNSTRPGDFSLTDYNFTNHYLIGGLSWEF
ncbi:MAG: LPS-assembly protein LptD [Bacteroidales bacterium]|nr:LPS-assembly protein LptD [Bacteroidales bacterium]